jgi:MoaA/NifB/PqqE/SkfB family radical SAM enzyme
MQPTPCDVCGVPIKDRTRLLAGISVCKTCEDVEECVVKCAARFEVTRDPNDPRLGDPRFSVVLLRTEHEVC